MSEAHWALEVLDADPGVGNLTNLATGDIDGDGQIEIVTGGDGKLLWYRPVTGERGLVGKGQFTVGIICEDVDGDGVAEVVAGLYNLAANETQIVYYKLGGEDWTRHVIDHDCLGGAHDIIFADLDDDGERELIANAAYSEVSGIWIYKRGADPQRPWRKHEVLRGLVTEGLAVGDLDGDGVPEIVGGPDWFKADPAGPFEGPWTRRTFAPNFREMCRVALADISGSGKPDILIVDSEYMDGRFSWFENRLDESENAWTEHLIETPVVYAHTLQVWQEDGVTHVYLAEMAQGGWDPPYNWDARHFSFASRNNGQSWSREVFYQGSGTHEAEMLDVDGDGQLEVAGKEVWRPKVHLWQQLAGSEPFGQYRHRFIDRDKPLPATDIVAADLSGTGREDIFCGRWWYRQPNWERLEIPGVFQIIAAHDIDGDGVPELIGTKRSADYNPDNWYSGLTSELVWLKPKDLSVNTWDVYDIGTGQGDWPHGNCVAPLLPGGKLALVTTYHSAHAGGGDTPEIFEIPDDPTQPWPKRKLTDVVYGEEVVPYDLTGNGTLDLVLGTHWLENLGDGTFASYRLIADTDIYPARLRVADINCDGKPEILIGEEQLDYETQSLPWSKFAYLSMPDDIRQPWNMTVVDTMRCPHSVEVADLDGDGELELIAGEHDPFWPYRNRCRLYVYKAKHYEGGRLGWLRYELPGHFEHHDGAKLVQLGGGRQGLMSHGWNDSIYVHLWEPS